MADGTNVLRKRAGFWEWWWGSVVVPGERNQKEPVVLQKGKRPGSRTDIG